MEDRLVRPIVLVLAGKIRAWMTSLDRNAGEIHATHPKQKLEKGGRWIRSGREGATEMWRGEVRRSALQPRHVGQGKTTHWQKLGSDRISPLHRTLRLRLLNERPN